MSYVCQPDTPTHIGEWRMRSDHPAAHRKTPISQLLYKNFSSITFLALIQGVCVLNFNSLASKLRVKFEVTDRQTTFSPAAPQ